MDQQKGEHPHVDQSEVLPAKRDTVNLLSKPRDQYGSERLTENDEYKPYALDEDKRNDLGKERKRFEEWEKLQFSDFIHRKEFQSPEALIGYFADHPQVNVKEELKELFLKGEYSTFISDFFKNETRLNPLGLSEEIGSIVDEVRNNRRAVIEKVDALNTKGTQAIEYLVGQPIPRAESDRLIVLPSEDVFYFVGGTSTQEVIAMNQQLGGFATYPTLDSEGRPYNSLVQRIAIVPIRYNIKVETGRLRVSFDADLAVRAAAHETEHARVEGSYDQEFAVGLKTLPSVGVGAEKADNVRKQEFRNDEAVTDFISIWKQLVADGALEITADSNTVLTAVEQNLSSEQNKGSYFKEVRELIMKLRNKAQVSITDPLQRLLVAYYGSNQEAAAWILQ